MAGLEKPLALITLYHTAAYSIVKAFQDAGLQVCAPQTMHIDKKLARIEEAQDADLIWAHWAWAERCPDWLLEREVITVLRDPMECAISARIRGNKGKAVMQAQQWLTLWRNRDRVDRWIDFKALDLTRYGIETLPHENATPDHKLKSLYRAGKHATLHKHHLLRQWECLLVARREIRDLFDLAGLSHRLTGTPFDPARP